MDVPKRWLGQGRNWRPVGFGRRWSSGAASHLWPRLRATLRLPLRLGGAGAGGLVPLGARRARAAIPASPRGFSAYGRSPTVGNFGSLFGCGIQPALCHMGGDDGESLGDTSELVLDQLNQPHRQPPSGPREQGLEQTHQNRIETLDRGKVWSVVHAP